MTHFHAVSVGAVSMTLGLARRLLGVAVLTAAALGVTRQAGAQAPAQEPLDKALIARGESIFQGRSGGALCFTCHGMKAKGTPGLGPDLTDAAWMHGDGSLPFLRTLVRAGVPKPKKSATPMPPFGGVPLDSAQVDAVTAYVYSLRRGPAK